MKTQRVFKGNRFLQAVVIAIVLAEFAAWKLSPVFGFRFNPLLTGFIATGAVAAFASWRYEGCDFE